MARSGDSVDGDMKRRARRLDRRGLVAAVVAVLLVGTGLSVEGALAQSVAGPPAISEIVEGSGEVTLSWTAPTSLPSGHTVVAYDLRHIENSETNRVDSNWTVVDNFWLSGPLTGDARSLVNGTEYDFQMRAVTSADGGTTNVDGSWSGIGSATARNSAPVIESLAGDEAATVVWSAPSEIAAGTDATYDVRWITSSATNKSDSEWTVASGLGGDPAHHIFRNLTNGTSYDVQVRVVSGHNGSWSTTSLVTPYEPGTGKPSTQSSIKIGVPIAAEFGTNTDVDVFKIVTTGPTNLVIYTTAERSAAGEAVAGEVDDTVCTLRSDANVSDGSDVLATNDNSYLQPLDSHCALAATVDAGTYYLEVRAFRQNGISAASKDVGNYVLHSSNQPAAGSSTTTATPFPPGEILSGTHTSADDVHYFRIDADEAEHIQVDVVWPVANNIITLHDADDAPESPFVTHELQCVVDNCFSLISTLTARVEAGVHYIRLQPPVDLAEGSVSRYYLKRGPDVAYSEFVTFCTGQPRHATLSDPLSGCQWHLNNSGQLGGTVGEDANVAAAHAAGYLGTGINVSVVDHGFDINHVDLTNDPPLSSTTFTACDREGEDVNDALVPFSSITDHGTQVAGVVGARANSIGMRGVAPGVTLYNYRLIHDTCVTTNGNIIEAMTQDRDLIAVSVNSWGGTDGRDASPTSSLFDRAIDTGLASGFGGKGTVYVWAGGNGGDIDDSNLDEYNNYYGVVAVCAVDDDGVRAAYSEKGENLWVCAPSSGGDGAGVATLTHYDRYLRDSGGTSAAAPIVAGVVAQMRAVKAALTWRDVKLILAASARRNDTNDTAGWSEGELRYRPDTDTDRYWFNKKYGFGVVDSLAAVEMAKNWTLLPEMITKDVDSTDRSFTIPDTKAIVTKTVRFDNAIDFVEYVQLDTDIAALSFRSLRIELVSPSGTVSVMSPELSEANTEHLTALQEAFRFGSSRHLGERAEGEWTLRVSDQDSGTPLNEDGAAELATVTSWGVKLFGHRLRPSAPQSVAVTTGPGTVTASWAAPEHNGAEAVNGYELAHIASAATARDDDNWTTVDIAAGTLTGTVTVSEETDVRVRATNSQADGEWSETITVTPDDDANAPVFPDSDSDGTADPVVRSVAENTTSGVVGAAITATDGDGDTLVYSVAATADGDAAAHLTAFNRDFALDSASGQISVNATAEINFEDRSTYTVLFQVSDGKDDSGVAETGTLTIDATLTLTVTVTDVNEAGVVTIGGTPQVGEELTATLTDLDGATSDVAWQWSRGDSPSGTFTDIADATEATYTPVDADAGMYLRATATYRDDTHDADGETAAGTAAAAVTSAPRFALDLGRLQVDSTGMASTDSIDRETESLVQAFTTGGKPSDEFVLRRVRLYTAVASGQSINEVAVWSNDPNVFRMSDGVPLVALADGVLSGPDSFDDDLASAEVFESASGVRLAGGTKYWLVVSKQEKADLRIRIPYLAASGVVTDSQTGWSLGQTAFDNENSQPWEYISGIHPWRMQIVTFPARSVPENAASGDAVVGGAITTTDADGDTLTYSVVATDASDGGADLTAFNRDFALNTGTGLISVKATGAMIDYETRSSYTVLYQVSDGEDASGTADTTVDDTVTVTVTVTNVDEPGVVTFDGMPQVDVVLTATLTDPDGSVSAEAWSWSKSATAGGTFTTIGGATDASYTPAAADVDSFLKAAVSYTDGFGSSRSAETTATSAVLAAAVVHTVPVFPDSDGNGTADPVVRSVAENTASGVVGAAITATDGDGDTLTYSVAATADGDAAAHLTAFNQHFDLDAGSGQISVKAGAVINFEARESYKVLYRVSDGEDASGAADAVIDDMLTLTVTVTNVDEPGVVTFDGMPQVDVVLTATLTDPDGSVSAEAWSWSKSATAGGTFTTIGGATDASYTPAAADVGMFLKAAVTYTDNVHSATGQTASGTTTSAVPHTAPRFALDLGRLQVDSTGMASTDSIDRETESLVQAFTTGGKPSDEFVLRRVRLYTAVASGQSINEVAVWSNDPNVFRMSDGVPLVALADGVLSGPDSFDDDLASAEVFESASGVRLAGGTKYWLVVSKQEKADLRIRIPYLAASGVVTDSQTGWSLGQTAFDNENSQPWEYITGIHPWRMQIVTFPARSVPENAASGDAVVGGAITTTDADGDTLTYSVVATDASDGGADLTAFNRDFALNTGTGLISVKATGAMIDYETRSSYTVLYQVSDGENASGTADTTVDDTVTVTVTVTNVDEPGVVTFDGMPQVDVVLTATLTDPDGSVSAEEWSWSKSATAGGTFTTIGGATDASYTPAAADVDSFLKAAVSYTDGFGSSRSAETTATSAVLAAAVVHTVPVFPDSDSDGTADPVVRSVAENTASGVVGAAITATDGDGDTLTYSVAATADGDAAAHLTAFNQHFDLDAASGQISVKAGAVINFEARESYKVLYRVSDGEDASGAADAVIDDMLTLTVTVTNVDEPGVVTIGGTPQVDVASTATLTDPDGSVSAEMWSWSKSATAGGAFTTIGGATDASYTPVAADVGMFLKAAVTYTDNVHSATGQTASGTTTSAVPHTAPRFALDLGRLQVDSTGMASTDSIDRETESLVQAFTTGGKPSDEFVLRRVRLYTAVASGQSINEVAVWSNDPNVFRMSDGVPLAALADGVLSGPDSFDDDLASAEVFESASGVRLAGGTKYWLVVSKQEKADLRIRIPYLAASGVVTDSQTGWSLARPLLTTRTLNHGNTSPASIPGGCRSSPSRPGRCRRTLRRAMRWWGERSRRLMLTVTHSRIRWWRRTLPMGGRI